MKDATLSRILPFAAFVLATFPFSSCGGGSATTPPPITYTVGGTVFDVSGTGLVLQNNSGNNLSISGNGSFVFTTPVASGGAYSVTVLTQPSAPPQTCAVTNGSGTANTKVTGIQVVCISEWTWVNGANIIDQKGTYGTLGIASPTNVPGARYCSVSWTDLAGNFWLFGGYGFD